MTAKHAISVFLLLNLVVGLQVLSLLHQKVSSRSSRSIRFLRMDDETARPGIKDDLTTRDEYLSSRFSRLSSSNHDLTPMTPAEVAEWDIHHEEYSVKGILDRKFDRYLGESDKGAYASRIGGLPLFTSGSRLENICSKSVLFFTEPCDPEHITLADWDGSFSNLSDAIKDTFPDVVQFMLVRCTRSGCPVGLQATVDGSVPTVFAIAPECVVFLRLDQPWPLESQAENLWGTEGQYLVWKQKEHL